MSADTRAVVDDLYDAYVKRDFERVADRIDDDIKWVIYAPRHVFGFSGPRRGKAAVLETLTAIVTDYAIEDYVPRITIVDGEHAAVLSDAVFSHRASGRVLNFRIADFLHVRNGRIVEFQEFIDTFDVVEQVLGRHISVA